jgi:hypothetical protein
MLNRNVVVLLLGLFALPAGAQDAPLQKLESAGPQLAPHQPYSDIVVVAFETLSGSTKQEVEDVIQDTTADDLRELQHTIGQSRQAILTLAAAGMNVNQVVAAGVTLDGVLTLVVQEIA